MQGGGIISKMALHPPDALPVTDLNPSGRPPDLSQPLTGDKESGMIVALCSNPQDLPCAMNETEMVVDLAP
ncbi:unnamed protein product [Linum trigynum]|uniref:Uncharacterized protein n=1 Tax=Linum trigynum TaxID=586398 RepID=A0AAV2E3V9_9ROSI